MKKTSGFTLIELIIAVSIFTVIVVATSYFYITSFRTAKDSAFRAQIVSDAEFVLFKISEALADGTIDYEEYNNQYVANGEYGANYGRYKGRFYAGSENTGQNPATGDSVSANALCGSPSVCTETTGAVPELYLINAAGDKKTIFVKEAIQGGYGLSFITMDGRDINSDGIMDDFECSADFECDSITKKPSKADFDNISNDPDYNKDFIPISPLRITISDLKFYIHPIENPFNAVMEAETQYTPYIKVMMEVEPNRQKVPTAPNISYTLQKTITTQLLTPPRIPKL